MSNMILARVKEVIEFDDEGTMEDEFEALNHAAAVIPMISLMVGSHLIDRFAPVDKAPTSNYSMYPKPDYKKAIPSESDRLAQQTAMSPSGSSASAFTPTVKLNKDSSGSIFVPVLRNFSIVNENNIGRISSTWFHSSDFEYANDKGQGLGVEVAAIYEKLFGKDIWDMDKSPTYTIPINPDVFNLPGLMPDAHDIVDEDKDWVMSLLQHMGKIVIVAVPADGSRATKKERKLADFATEEEKNKHKHYILHTRKFTVMVEYLFSPETVQYATQSLKPNIVNFHQFATVAVREVSDDDEIQYAFNPLTNIKKQNEGRKIISSRVNKDNIAIDSDGQAIYVPTQDRIQDFEKAYTESGLATPELGWGLRHPSAPYSPTKTGANVANKVIYYDPYYFKLVYTSNNTLYVKELDDCVEAGDHHIYGVLNSKLESNTVDQAIKRMKFYLNNTIPGSKTYGKVDVDLKDFRALFDYDAGRAITDFNNYYWNGELGDKEFKRVILDYIENSTPENYISEITSMMRLVKNYWERQAQGNDDWAPPKGEDWLYQNEPESLMLKHIAPNSEIAWLRPLGQLFKNLSDELLKDPVRYIEERSPAEGMAALGLATVFSKYLPDYDRISKKNDEYIEKLRPPTEIKQDWKAQPLAGAVPGYSYLPHQGGVHQKIAKNPPLVILSVDAGGGKTHLALTKIIQILTDKLYKRPLVICPPDLVANYVADIITVAGGNWNIFPITSSVVKLHGEESIANMVKRAPANTIFLTDYYFVKGNMEEVPYASTYINVGVNSEFLRGLEFDVVFADESHKLKNENSHITIATTQLMNTIPSRYLMSGTLVDGALTDLVSQVRVLDPTIFGSMDDFFGEYADTVSGGKVVTWKEGAPRKIREKINSRICMVQAKKKEWSALLPDRVEKFHEARLTPNQKMVYDAILTEVLDEIRANAKLMARINRAEDDDTVSLESALGPYLARLEIFLTSPAEDPLGAKLLTEDEDLISPKVLRIIDIMEDHLKQKKRGKCLIFTSYNKSADSIFDNLPPKLRKKTIRYKAAQKAQHKAQFIHDDEMEFMVGVEQSLNTGHNFQMVSRVIRNEAVWNPGTLEQAESRIFRPDVNNLYDLNAKNLDWVIASQTIDVTKAARLMSKVLNKVLFDEADNKHYDGLKELDLIPMTLDRIETSNDFEDDLGDHIETYQEFRKRQKDEYREYREDPKTLKKPFKVATAKMPEGSAFLEVSPYVDNHRLPFEDELGIQPSSIFAAENGSDVDAMDFSDMAVHTELGDGIVQRSTRSTISVRIKGVLKTGITKSKTFVFLDQKAAKKAINADKQGKTFVRMKLAQMTQLPVRRPQDGSDKQLPDRRTNKADAPVVDKVKIKDKALDTIKKVEERLNKPVPNQDFELNNSVEMFALGVNNQIAIAIDTEDPDVPTPDTMKALGFFNSGRHHYVEITSKRVMNNLMQRVEGMIAKGHITIPAPMMKNLKQVQDAFNQSKSRALALDLLQASEMRLFERMRMKKSEDPKAVYLQVYIEDGSVYAIVTVSKAKRGDWFVGRPIKGVSWDEDAGNWMALFKNKSEAKTFAEKIMKTMKITNRKDFIADFKSLKIRKVKGE